MLHVACGLLFSACNLPDVSFRSGTGKGTVSQRESRIRGKRQYHSPYFGECTALSVDSAQTLG